MGWSNYIIIQRMKVIVEVSREFSNEDLSESEKNALSFLTNNESFEFIDMENIKIKDLNLKDIKNFTKCVDLVNDLSGIDVDKLLLFWLKSRDIPFIILSELSKEWEAFDKFEYKIITRI